MTEILQTELIHLPFTAEDPELAPRRAHESDAGWDLRAAEDVFLEPGEFLPVPTGLRAAVPTGFSLDIRARAGAARSSTTSSDRVSGCSSAAVPATLLS